MDMLNPRLGLCDLDLIFKVTAGKNTLILDQKLILCSISPEQLSRFELKSACR